MRTFFIYLQLEIKRTGKNIPYFITGAIVLALFAGAIAFSAGKMLYGERAVGTIQVGVVIPEEDALAAKAMRMIESLDSVDSLCDFVYLEEEEGLRGLRQGEFFALMKFPEGLVEGIMDGTNLPITVVFPERAGPETAVFRELTEAGSGILGTAQAGIYAADDYLYSREMAVHVPKAEEDLNGLFLRYALSRDVYFRMETVSAAGEVGTAAHFAIAAAVMMLLLLGIPAAPLMRRDSMVLRQKLALLGIGPGLQTAARLFCLKLLLLLVSAVPFFLGIHRGYLKFSAGNLWIWFWVCLAAAAWIQMFYGLCRNSAAAILFLFTTTSVMLFLAGGIIPAVFLPEMVQAAGAWTPAALIMDAIRCMITGAERFVSVKLMAAAAVCFAVSAAAGKKE